MTLIEVMIAFLILSLGILASLTMQISIKKANFDAQQRALASLLAVNIAERMMQQPADIIHQYSGLNFGKQRPTPPNKLCLGIDTRCSLTEMVQFDLYQWQQLLTGELVIADDQPIGGLHGASACIGVKQQQVSIAIRWRSLTLPNQAQDCQLKQGISQQVLIRFYIA